MDEKNKFGDFEIDQTLLTPLTFDEPELRGFDVADVFEPVTEAKPAKKRFGKRSERRTEVRVKAYDAFEDTKQVYNEIPEQNQAQGSLLEQMTLSDSFGKEETVVEEPAVEKVTVEQTPVDTVQVEEKPVAEQLVEEEQSVQDDVAEEPVEEETVEESDVEIVEKPLVEEVSDVVEETVEDENQEMESTMEMKPISQEEEATDIEIQEEEDEFIPETEEEDEDDVVFPVDEEVETPKEDSDQYDEDDLLYEKKRFLISDYDKKEEYLRKQSKEGYHLVRVSGRTYYFREGPAMDYYYSYAYFRKDPTEEMWNEWEKDGWKLVCRQVGKKKRDAGWFIFRNETVTGEYRKYIENDLEKFNFFKKEVSSYRSTQFLLFICLAVCAASAYLQYYFNGFLAGIIACGVVGFIALIYWLRYGKLARCANRKKKKLKSRLRVRKAENEVIEKEKDADEDWDTLEDVLNDQKKNKKKKK